MLCAAGFCGCNKGWERERRNGVGGRGGGGRSMCSWEDRSDT